VAILNSVTPALAGPLVQFATVVLTPLTWSLQMLMAFFCNISSVQQLKVYITLKIIYFCSAEKRQ
jgi:hypothetical protein